LHSIDDLYHAWVCLSNETQYNLISIIFYCVPPSFDVKQATLPRQQITAFVKTLFPNDVKVMKKKTNSPLTLRYSTPSENRRVEVKFVTKKKKKSEAEVDELETVTISPQLAGLAKKFQELQQKLLIKGQMKQDQSS